MRKFVTACLLLLLLLPAAAAAQWSSTYSALGGAMAANDQLLCWDVSDTGTYANGVVKICYPADVLRVLSGQVGVDAAAAATVYGVRRTTVASLGTGTTANNLALVTDGTSAGDCTSGGGAALALCGWTGAAWTAVGADAAATWGGITGTLGDQSDLSSALAGKQPLDADLTDLADGTLSKSKVQDSTTWDTAYTHSQTTTGNPHSLDADDLGDGAVNAIPTLTQEANWDAAYGWGDHDGLYQAADADLDTFAGISPSVNVQSLLGAADYDTVRTLLTLQPGTDVQAFDSDLADLAALACADGLIPKRASGVWDCAADDGGAGGGYTTVLDEGTSLTQRTVLNFVGVALTASDDAGNTRTNVTADPDLNALAALTGTGIPKRTGVDAWGWSVPGTDWEAAGSVSTHAAAADPHTGYMRESIYDAGADGLVDDAAIAATVARDSEVSGAVSGHNSVTTSVHGIADTSALLDTGDIGVSVQAPLVAGTDYLAPGGDGSGLSGVVTSEADPVVGAVDGIVECDGAGNCAASTEIGAGDDGEHYVNVYNSVAFSGTPAVGDWNDDGDAGAGPRRYTGAGWDEFVMDSDVGTKVQAALGTASEGGGYYLVEESALGVQGLGRPGNWKMLYTDGDGVKVESFDIGSTGTYLKSNGTGGAPSWDTPAGSGTINSGSQYHLPYYTAAGTTVGDSGIVVASDGSSLATVKTAQADGLTLAAGTAGGETTGWRWEASDTAMADTFVAKLPATEPTAGQVLAFGAPSSHVSTASYVTPVLTSDIGTTVLAPGGDGSGLSGVVTTETDPVVGAVTGLVQADGGGNISAAAAGTDYQAPLVAGTDYQTPLAAGTDYLAPTGDGSGLTGVDAATGDSATAFFDAGTLEHERGGLEADVSAYAGLVKISGGATSQATRADYATAGVISSHASPTTDNPYALAAASAYAFVLFYGATGEIDLPAGAAGMNGCVYNTGAFTITLDPNASEVVVRDGTAQTGGVSVTLSSGAGNYVCLVHDGARWVTLGYQGTLGEGS